MTVWSRKNLHVLKVQVMKMSPSQPGTSEAMSRALRVSVSTRGFGLRGGGHDLGGPGGGCDTGVSVSERPRFSPNATGMARRRLGPWLRTSPRFSGGPPQPAEDDVVDAASLPLPVARRVELPQAGEREDHAVSVQVRARVAGSDVRRRQAVEGSDDRVLSVWRRQVVSRRRGLA